MRITTISFSSAKGIESVGEQCTWRAALHLIKLWVRDGSSNEDLGAAIRYAAENYSLAVEMVDDKKKATMRENVLCVGEVCNAIQYH
jgi:hypothetical protein